MHPLFANAVSCMSSSLTASVVVVFVIGAGDGDGDILVGEEERYG